jgi:Sulfotransferase domain
MPSRIIARLRRIADRWSRSAQPAPMPPGWQSITQTEPADVFIVAYPKSGITWFQSLVAGAVYGLDPGQAPDRLTQDLVPDVHYKPCYKRYRSPTFFKSHHLPRPEYRRVVYLLRDGRDVMVSYWHHLRALGQADLDIAEMMRGNGLFPCKWHEHVEQWSANPFDAEILLIRYEDLQANAAQELARFCAFVDEPRDAVELARVAQQCSFTAMRRREERFGWDNAAWPKDRPFVRRGLIGSHRDEMPAEALETFVADAGGMLHQYRYV